MTASIGRPLRVLQVVHVYHPVVGGSPLLFQKIAEGLVDRGVDVTVFSSTAPSATNLTGRAQDALPIGVETIGGVRVRRFSHRQFSPLALRALSGAAHVWTLLRAPGYGKLKAIKIGPHVPRLTPNILDFDADVIAATAAPCLPIFQAAAAAARARRPIAIMPCLHPDHDWFMDNPSLIALLRRANGVMALTTYEIEVLRGFGVPSERLFLIGGGVDPRAASGAQPGVRREFGIGEADPLVVFLGRKEQAKGVGVVLQAMSRLWNEGVPATLVIAGSATDYSRTTLAEAIAELPAAWKRRVLARDDIADEEKWRWLVDCDVLAHPSRDESFGIVYLEAWSCGKAVIGGRTGSQRCVIEDERDGLLVAPGDVDELTGALRKLLRDREYRSRLGDAGRRKVLSQFTWSSVVDRAEAMYRCLASGETPASRDRR
jgi:glycosyltransferase involved in cell wall biosynthesis